MHGQYQFFSLLNLDVNHKRRLNNLQSTLGEHRLDIFLITHLPNIRYLCGFTGSAAALLITETSALFFSDGRYTQQAKAEVQAARVVIAPTNPVDAAASWLSDHFKKPKSAKSLRLGIEAEHLTVAQRSRLIHKLPKLQLVEAPALVEQARMIKDADEIKLVKEAAKVGRNLISSAISAIKSGKKESEVAASMEFAARKAGAEAMSFSTIIAGGERSSLPHARASHAKIPQGSFVVCDFGVILAGYCSDRTRTVFKGRPSIKQRDVYAAVLEAQKVGIAAVRPGITAGDVDAACRKVLQKNGLAKYFTHSTGHGVGLEIHEAPRLAAGQSQVLQPGMVVTIEPGVYLPGKFGVRIEDMVLVTKNGCEVLAPDSKELITV